MLTNLRIVSTIEDVLEGGWNLEDLNTAWNEFLKRLIGFLPQLLVAAVILLVGLLATKVVPKPIKSVLNRTRLDAVAVKYILRVVKISIWALVLMMVLDTVGVPVTSLLTLLAAIGAAVALAIKDNLANLASGVVLLFTKPFKAGDFIEVEGDSGVIREIEMMHTYLDTPGNMRVAIPNTKMMTATIINYSTYETRRQDLTFTISYEDNLLEAMAALQQLLDTHPQVLREPEEPIVRVKEQADSAIVLLARFWCANADYWNLQYDLLQQVKLTFDDKGISIPFPQMDVHVK